MEVLYCCWVQVSFLWTVLAPVAVPVRGRVGPLWSIVVFCVWREWRLFYWVAPGGLEVINIGVTIVVPFGIGPELTCTPCFPLVSVTMRMPAT